MSTSQVTTPSMVAMFGCIMPEPLHMPPRVTTRPSISTWIAVDLYTKSVVVIAVAQSFAAASVSERSSTTFGMAPNISSTLMRWPMTPVDCRSASSAGIPRHLESSAAESMASCHPRDPVAAFACPALMSTAETVFPGFPRTSLEYVTGAAHTRFCVKTPAAATAPSGQNTSARSGLSLEERSPAAAPEARNPRGAVTPRSGRESQCELGGTKSGAR
mmetsp:Transcript_5523/g.19216  ORF Transcript_5523/g.19216 Transcript_5523/m.19216 type:complete len:217 (-) Transcript_5523:133-783(-)